MNSLNLDSYPRPSFKRDSFHSLNGEWEYKIEGQLEKKNFYDGIINVPYTLETDPNIMSVLLPHQVLTYHRIIKIEEKDINKTLLLHFEAVDQICTVYINDVKRYLHRGGFTPFTVEITDLEKEIDIRLEVTDYTDTSFYGRGKQVLKPKGIFYPPQSGAYFPIWYEFVPKKHIDSIKITSHFDENEVEFYVNSITDEDIRISFEGKDYKGRSNTPLRIKLDSPKPWSIANPYLYPVTVTLDEDRVETYFGYRKIETKLDKNGYRRVFLNNEPIFLNGVLDQGYYMDTLLTPKSFDDYLKDITFIKSLGFNMIRKHIKREMDYFYYLCDKEGVLVIQDFINGGTKYNFFTISLPLVTNAHKDDHNYKAFSRVEEEGREFFINESKALMDTLYNHPSVIVYTIFNEGWGQFDAKENYLEFSKYDPTRLYDHASGWHDQGVSDFVSQHVYFKKYKLPKKKQIKDRVVFLSEFGGYSLFIKGHTINDTEFGYKKTKSIEDLTDKIVRLYENEIIPNIKLGLSALVYTQLSDVETELNGLITYDREVIKVNQDKIKIVNDKIYKIFIESV